MLKIFHLVKISQPKKTRNHEITWNKYTNQGEFLLAGTDFNSERGDGPIFPQSLSRRFEVYNLIPLCTSEYF